MEENKLLLLFKEEIQPLMNPGEWYTAEKLKRCVKPLNEQGCTIAEVLSWVFNHTSKLIRTDADKITFKIPRGLCTWAYMSNTGESKVESVETKSTNVIQTQLNLDNVNQPIQNLL